MQKVGAGGGGRDFQKHMWEATACILLIFYFGA